jgi:hypothetical protein
VTEVEKENVALRQTLQNQANRVEVVMMAVQVAQAIQVKKEHPETTEMTVYRAYKVNLD